MTNSNNHVALVAALQASIQAEHPGESTRDHEHRLANALRGLFEAKPIAYDPDLYPAAVREIVPSVADPTKVVIEPDGLAAELQAELRFKLVDAVASALGAHAVALIRRWLRANQLGLAEGLAVGDSYPLVPDAGFIEEALAARLHYALNPETQVDDALDGVSFIAAKPARLEVY